MGLLIKFLLFGLVIYYVLRTVGGFVARLMGGGQPPQQQNQHAQETRREGDINIDYIPKEKNGGSSGGTRQGDYIDYEEVK